MECLPPRSPATTGWAGAGGASVKLSSTSCRRAVRRGAAATFRHWLATEALPHEPNRVALEEEIGAWFAHGRVARTGVYRLDRIGRSARAAHDEQAFRAVADRLDAETRHRLGGLLADDGTGAAFTRLQADPGRVGLESLLAEIGKLSSTR